MEPQKIKEYAIVGLIIIGLLVSIYLFGKRAGKKDYPDFPLPGPTDPGVGGGGNNDDLSQAERNKAERLAREFFGETKGWNLTYDKDIYDEYLGTTERVFIATYNIFNDKYRSEMKGKTLRQVFESERGWFQYSLFATVKAIIQRMDNLGMHS